MKKICYFGIFISFLSFSSCTPKTVSNDKKSTTSDTLSFIVIGDWGVGGTPAQRKVADEIDKVSRHHRVQFIITTGDNFYPVGVASVNDVHWDRSFNSVYDKEGHMVPWYPTLGNHDYNGSPSAEIEYSKHSARWKLPSTYYSFSKKAGKSSVTFVFADMNPFIKSYYNQPMPELKDQDTAAQYKWLKQTLSSKADWKIMVGHQPLFSVGSHGSSNELINRFKPLLNETSTNFYIAGHDHNLQHIKLPNEQVNYLVSGGGGRGLYALKGTDPNVKFAVSSHGFLLMKIHGKTAAFYFYNEKGEVLYEQEIRK